MEITARSKLYDILEVYPQLEEQIIGIAPPFKNLRNPILRRTVGQLATLEKVAQVGQMDVTELVNTLRAAVGQEKVQSGPVAAPFVPPAPAPGDPDWIEGTPRHLVDGTALLQDGEVPLQRVNDLLKTLPSGEFILLTTDFKPAPIIEAMEKQGRTVYYKTQPGDENLHLTYIG